MVGKTHLSSDNIITPKIVWKSIYSGARLLRREGNILMGRIENKWYSGRKGSQGLNRRTGRAANAWKYKPAQKGDQFSFRLVNNSGYAGNFHKARVIRPKNSRYLAIPIMAGLTRTGRPRYTGPRDSELENKTFLVRSRDGKGWVIMGYGLTGTKGDGTPIYALRKEVRIPAYTSRMNPWIAGQADNFHEKLQRAIMVSMDKQLRGF